MYRPRSPLLLPPVTVVLFYMGVRCYLNQQLFTLMQCRYILYSMMPLILLADDDGRALAGEGLPHVQVPSGSPQASILLSFTPGQMQRLEFTGWRWYVRIIRLLHIGCLP